MPVQARRARPARRAISELLPKDIATAAVELVTGPLLEAARLVGRPLRAVLGGSHSARLGTEWYVVYGVDETKHAVVVQDIEHRSVVHSRR